MVCFFRHSGSEFEDLGIGKGHLLAFPPPFSERSSLIFYKCRTSHFQTQQLLTVFGYPVRPTFLIYSCFPVASTGPSKAIW